MVLKYHGPLSSFKYPTDSSATGFITWRKGDVQRNTEGAPGPPVSDALAAKLLTDSKHRFTADQATVDAAAEHIESMPAAPVEISADAPPAEVAAAINALGSNTAAVESMDKTLKSTTPSSKVRSSQEP